MKLILCKKIEYNEKRFGKKIIELTDGESQLVSDRIPELLENILPRR